MFTKNFDNIMLNCMGYASGTANEANYLLEDNTVSRGMGARLTNTVYKYNYSSGYVEPFKMLTSSSLILSSNNSLPDYFDSTISNQISTSSYTSSQTSSTFKVENGVLIYTRKATITAKASITINKIAFTISGYWGTSSGNSDSFLIYEKTLDSPIHLDTDDVWVMELTIDTLNYRPNKPTV